MRPREFWIIMEAVIAILAPKNADIAWWRVWKWVSSSCGSSEGGGGNRFLLRVRCTLALYGGWRFHVRCVIRRWIMMRWRRIVRSGRRRQHYSSGMLSLGRHWALAACQRRGVGGSVPGSGSASDLAWRRGVGGGILCVEEFLAFGWHHTDRGCC